jgi:hypothetical protein
VPLLRALILLPYLVCSLAFAATVERWSSPKQQESVDSSVTALKNKDVLDMLSAGLTEEIVVAKINSSRCDFDTSPEALKGLKGAKVPDGVILAMIKAPTTPKTPPTLEPIIRTAKVTCIAANEIPLLPAPGDLHPIRQISCGSEIFVLKENEQDPWYKVRTPDGTVGYVSEFFIPKPSPTPATTPGHDNAVAPSPIPQNMIKAIAWRAVPWVTTSYYQTPGSANTQCTGGGSWIGNIWQGSSSCSTQYTPAQTVPINWQHVTVYNLVETSNSRMVIACTRNWAFSKCSSLVPGDVFPFEYKKGKIEITGHKVGNVKEEELSFDIVSSQQR